MAYHTYTTEGIILRTHAVSEASKNIFIFTPDLGIVRASAQGVRLHASKLRYNTQEFMFSKVSLIRGRRGWKLTYAESQTPYFSLLRAFPGRASFMSKSALLIRRLLGEENPNKDLFDVYKAFLDFLVKTNLKKEELVFAEYIVALRILHHLGYLGGDDIVFDAVHTKHWSDDLVKGSSPFARDMIHIINESIQETQL